MVNVAITVLSLVVIAVAVAVKGQSPLDVPSAVLSETTEASATPEETVEPTVEASASPSATPMVTQTPSPSPKPSPTSAPTSQNISAWIYSGSSVKSQSDTEVHLQISADAQSVTNWYRSKLSELKFNISTNVVASSNDKVHNSLGGSNSNTTISVDIQQESNSSPVIVVVKLSGPSSSMHTSVSI